jgi:nitrate/TMAO reductase-like tetraheme cytochrome c subunit
MLVKKSLLLVSLALFIGGFVQAQDFKYIGAAKCKMCHNKPNKGEQYNRWMEGPHSKAMNSLSNEESMEYAKANGIADPTKEPSCLKCHATAGHAPENLQAGIKVDEGVSCESCHGPGSVYKNMAIMKSREKSMENGLILPTKEVCVSCHNEDNPFYKPFDFEAAYAKIAHPDPTLD